MTLYELIIDEKRTFLELAPAGRAYDNGWVDVRFGSIVYEDGVTRSMTNADRKAISDAADSHSESK